MALTEQQLNELEYNKLQLQQRVEVEDESRRQFDLDMEALRHKNTLAVAAEDKARQLAIIEATTAQQALAHQRQAKLEAVRLAKEILIENARTKPVDMREITAQNVQELAQQLETQMNS